MCLKIQLDLFNHMLDNIYMLKIYISSVNAIDNKIDFYISYLKLSKERKQKVKKLKNYRAKCLCIISELLLKKALCELNINDEIIYSYNKHKKPYLKNYADIYFNYSHSNEYVICVISDNEIGCDLQYIDKLNSKLYRRFFSKEEVKFLDTLSDEKKVNKFFEFWTLKESYIKYIGDGLAMPLDSFNVLEKDKLEGFFYSVNINSDYKCSVCSKYKEQIEIYNVYREDLL